MLRAAMADAAHPLSALLPRDASNDDFSGLPEHRTRAQNWPTLLVSWWCTGFALAFILARLWGRAERVGKLFVEDKIMALSIIPLLIRMAFVHPILLFGTNNSQVDNITSTEEYHRMVGSKLVLCSRIFYALFIWTAKWTVSEYLKRMTSFIWTSRHQFILHCIRIFLIITFVGVIIGTLSECQPFDHYWQVVPDPGPQCRNGFAQLLVMGISDIITDIVLIAFPLHLVITSSMPLKRKVGLSILFSFSVFLIAITAYRMPTIIQAKGRQQLRTLWASLEILAAAAVSNALVLGSFVRDKGVKRAKYKGARSGARARAESSVNGAQPSINREMTKQHWGNDSDENLFRSLRGRLDSVTETVTSSDHTPTIVRPIWTSTTNANSQVLAEEDEDVEDQASNESPLGTRYDCSITMPLSALTKREHADDFSFGPKDESVPSNRTQSPVFEDVGGLLHYSPPPTAKLPVPTTSEETSRSTSPDRRDWYTFHRSQRRPFDYSQSPQLANNLPVATSTASSPPEHLTETLPFEDLGGLLSTPPPQSTAEAKPQSPVSPPLPRAVRGLWGRPSGDRKRSSSNSRSRNRDTQPDSLSLNDPGGLLR